MSNNKYLNCSKFDSTQKFEINGFTRMKYDKCAFNKNLSEIIINIH